MLRATSISTLVKSPSTETTESGRSPFRSSRPSRKALVIQRNAGSWATVFTVQGDAQAVTVDLDLDYLDPSGGGAPLVVLAA